MLSLVAAVLSVPLAVHAFSGWKSPDVPLLLLQSMPLFFLVNTSYHEERFEFFDLIVKRGLALVASLLAFVVWFVWALPAIGRFGPDAARPWLLALGVLPLVWLLPIVRGWIGRLVDRRLLGRRYSIERGYAELVDQVLLAMQPASTEAQLADEVSRAFSTLLRRAGDAAHRVATRGGPRRARHRARAGDVGRRAARRAAARSACAAGAMAQRGSRRSSASSPTSAATRW